MNGEHTSGGPESGRPIEALPPKLYETFVEAGWVIPTTAQEVQSVEKSVERYLADNVQLQAPAGPSLIPGQWRRNVVEPPNQSIERDEPELGL